MCKENFNPMVVRHPATFSKPFIEIFVELLAPYPTVFDPFAGTGKLAEIKKFGYTGKVICNEIEPDWASCKLYDVDEWRVGDAEYLTWAKDGMFDALCTSPTYGNRMADSHNAKDSSKRITYTHVLGKKLNEANTGKMKWGNSYRNKHVAIYAECIRVLKPEGLFIVNISNHIRKGKVMEVVMWTIETLSSLGLKLTRNIEIPTKRMKFGRNQNVRVPNENILVFKKPT